MQTLVPSPLHRPHTRLTRDLLARFYHIVHGGHLPRCTKGEEDAVCVDWEVAWCEFVAMCGLVRSLHPGTPLAGWVQATCLSTARTKQIGKQSYKPNQSISWGMSCASENAERAAASQENIAASMDSGGNKGPLASPPPSTTTPPPAETGPRDLAGCPLTELTRS